MSTKRTLKLRPVEAFYPAGKVERFLTDAGVEFEGVKKKESRAFVLVSFESEEQMRSAIPKLSDLPLNKKRKAILMEEQEYVPCRKIIRKESNTISPKPVSNAPPKDVRDAVTPLWKLSYEDQLEQKRKSSLNVLNGLQRRINKTYRMAGAKSKYPNIPFEGVLHAEPTDGYRNKVSYTISGSVEKPIVGFRVGRHADAQGHHVASPEECRNVPADLKLFSPICEALIRSSMCAPYDELNHTGFWRRLVCRKSKEGTESMVVLQTNPDPAMSEERIREIQKTAVDLFQRNHPTLKTILWQEYSGVSNAAPSDLPTTTLFGPGFILDEQCGLRFQIQADSFFQTNNAATEVLYGKVKEWISSALLPNEKPVLLDVCCGTGTIGMVLADIARKVVGLELVESAVQDAHKNVALNAIDNVEFICGKAEETLENAMQSLKLTDEDRVVAVVDPPRPGLHSRVVRLLRENESITDLVYVSCNPKSMAEDMLHLLKEESKKYCGTPFVVTKSAAVDMFPHTEHCEMVVHMQRRKESSPQS